MDVHTGSQPHPHAEGFHFRAYNVAAFFDQLQIPGAGQQPGDGNGGAVLIVVHVALLLGSEFLGHAADGGAAGEQLSLRIGAEVGNETQTGRAVGIDHIPHAPMGQSQAGFAGSAGNRFGSGADYVFIVSRRTHAPLGHFFNRELGNQLLHGVLAVPDLLQGDHMVGAGGSEGLRLPGVFNGDGGHLGGADGEYGSGGLLGVLILGLPAFHTGAGDFLKFLIQGADILDFLGLYSLIQPHQGCHMGIPAVHAHPDHILAGLQHIGGLGGIVAFQVGQLEGNLQLLALPGLEQPGLAEAAQHLHGLFQTGSGSGAVDLDHFPAGESTGVGDLYGYGNLLFVSGSAQGLHGEGGVIQAVAEGIQGLHIEGVEVAVADEDTVGVVFVVPVAVVVAEGGGGGVVHVFFGPGVGESAAGDALAQQHIRHDVAAHVAALGDEQHGADAGDGLQGGRVDHAAQVQQHDNLLVAPAQGGEQGNLCLGQLIVAFLGVAVTALAGVPAQHIDGQVALCLLEGSQSLGDEMLVEHHEEIGDAHRFGPLMDVGHVGAELFLNHPVLLSEPLLSGNFEAGLLQTLLHADAVAAVDLTAAGAALHGGSGAVAVKCHLLGAGQGQNAVVFQQHHALTGDPADAVAVGALAGGHFGRGVCVIVNHFCELLSDGRGCPFSLTVKILVLLYKMMEGKSMLFSKNLERYPPEIPNRQIVIWRVGAASPLALPLGELSAPYGAD